MRTVVVKINKQRPIDADPTYMNARKKEKKKILSKAQKPTKDSEWVALGDNWLKWVQENKWSMNIDDYANAHGYKPYCFKKNWVKESEIHQGYLEQIIAILHFRRNQYMDSKDKFYLQILKELPIYNWDFRDYEESLKKNSEQMMGDIHVHIDEAPSSDKVPHKKGK